MATPETGLQPNELCLQRAAHGGLALADEHVDLGPDAERVRVDARLDREAGAGDQPALVVGLVVVHVDAVAVHFRAEAVPGAMDELRAEPRLLDDRPACAIDFETAQ